MRLRIEPFFRGGSEVKAFNDIRLVIRKNEEQDDSSALVIDTDNEKETVRIVKRNWGSDNTTLGFPRQFIGDVIKALQTVADHNAKQ